MSNHQTEIAFASLKVKLADLTRGRKEEKRKNEGQDQVWDETEMYRGSGN